MVKNESVILTRLLDSAKPYVQAMIICDTGSTDATVSVATDYLAANQMAGTVIAYPFVNFGLSRTESFHRCQEWIATQGWDPKDTWAILLDADMTLGAPIRLPEDPLLTGISLKQKNGALLYTNVRVLRCSEPWICKGSTHEVWVSPGQVINLEAPVLLDYNDGGSKADKYERDARLLLEDLSGTPLDTRTHFYLGQTYMCLKDYPRAIESLKKRIALGGWDEEVYVAQVYLGECYEAIGANADAVYTWLAAWQRRQHRTEAAIKVIQHYRKEPASQFLGWMFLEKLFSTSAQKNADILFVNKRDIEFSMWEELGILGFYVDRKKETAVRLDEFDLITELEWNDANRILVNLQWYDVPADCSRVQVLIPTEDLPWAKEPQAEIWEPFNPSLRIHDGRYELNLRYANYYTQEASSYMYRGTHDRVITRNCLVTLDNSTWNKPKHIEEITLYQYADSERRDSAVIGVEDCRFIQGSTGTEFLCTSISFSSTGINKMFRLYREVTWKLTELPLPPGVPERDPQKNWLGFYQGGMPLYIYSWSPYKVCRLDGSVYIDKMPKSRYRLYNYRGSANPVPWASTANPRELYLCVIHKVTSSSSGRRYYHRFITLDWDLLPSRVSRFVRMTKERIEYWSGLCPSLDGGSYWICYGIKDCEAWIATMTQKQIDNLLVYSF
jgi:glycosyltransferase involved in cell wall biosynthesis